MKPLYEKFIYKTRNFFLKSLKRRCAPVALRHRLFEILTMGGGLPRARRLPPGGSIPNMIVPILDLSVFSAVAIALSKQG